MKIYRDGDSWMVVPSAEERSARLLATCTGGETFFQNLVDEDFYHQTGLRVWGDLQKACLVSDCLRIAGDNWESN